MTFWGFVKFAPMKKPILSPERLAERMRAVNHSPDDGGQSWLARQVDMTQQGVQSMLAGKSGRPRLLREIARVLETSEAYLLGETDDPSPAKQGAVSANVAYPIVRPGDRQALKRLVNQIAGLKSDNIKVLISSVEGFWFANGELQAPSQPHDQSEPANRPHDEAPSGSRSRQRIPAALVFPVHPLRQPITHPERPV